VSALGRFEIGFRLRAASFGRGRSHGLVALLLAAGLLGARPAAAWDFTIKGRELNLAVTDTFKYTYHFDDGDRELDHDRFHQFLNVLDVSLGYDVFRLGGRFDLNLFANTPIDQQCGGASPPSWCAEKDRYPNHFAVERAYFIVARPEFDLVLGDFYASLGKGIALNVVKLDELGQDTAIRGGKIIVHHKDLELTFLGGEINPLDVDEASARLAGWPAEPLLAGRLEYRFFDALILGAHGVYVITNYAPNSPGTKQERTDYNAIWGVGFELPNIRSGLFSVAGEVDMQRTVYVSETTRGPGADDFKGIAAYLSSSLHVGQATLLAELKYYDDFQLGAQSGDQPKNRPYDLLYHQPPTLERINAQLSDNTSVAGGRLRFDYNFGQRGPVELQAFVNYGYFYDWFHGWKHHIHDPYAGVDLLWQDGAGHAQLSGGVRREENRPEGDDPPSCSGWAAPCVYHQDAHVDLEVEQRLRANHSLKLTLQVQRRAREESRMAGPVTEQWNEVDLALNYKWSPRLALALTYERQEDPSVISGRTPPSVPEEPLLGAGNYVSGVAQYYFTPSTYVSVRAGSSRPGLKCLNGVCRMYPGFAGVQVSMVGRF